MLSTTHYISDCGKEPFSQLREEEPKSMSSLDNYMKTAVIYHGSHKVIRNPIFRYGNPNNDYGLGFYLTTDVNRAGEWAVLYNKRDGYINSYVMDYSGLNVLSLNERPIESWIAVLAKNRKVDYMGNISGRINRFIELYDIDTSEYDVIIGYRADDAFFSYISDFFFMTLSLEKMKESMKFGDLGNQVCLKSKRAFSKIKFISPAIKAQMSEYYAEAEYRDREAKAKYRNLGNKTQGTLLIDLIGRDYL